MKFAFCFLTDTKKNKNAESFVSFALNRLFVFAQSSCELTQKGPRLLRTTLEPFKRQRMSCASLFWRLRVITRPSIFFMFTSEQHKHTCCLVFFFVLSYSLFRYFPSIRKAFVETYHLVKICRFNNIDNP